MGVYCDAKSGSKNTSTRQLDDLVADHQRVAQGSKENEELKNLEYFRTKQLDDLLADHQRMTQDKTREMSILIEQLKNLEKELDNISRTNEWTIADSIVPVALIALIIRALKEFEMINRRYVGM